MERESIRTFYATRRNEFAERASELANHSNQISLFRLFAALVAFVCLLAAIWGDASIRWFSALLSALGAAAFVALVIYHRRVAASQTRFAELSAINQQTLARVERNWKRVPLPREPADLPPAPFAADLDLFGRRSLFHLVAQPASPQGRRTLAEWFLQPADPPTIAARQQAIGELTPGVELRQECARLGDRISREGSEAEPFLLWCEGESWLASRRWLLWASRLLPVLLAVFVVLQLAGVLGVSLWLLVAAANVAISFAYCRRIHQVFGQISTNIGQIKDYVTLFEAVATCQGDSERLAEIRRAIGHDTRSAIAELRRLGRIMDLADLRFSQIHGIIQAATLWDIHVLMLAEAWKAARARARRWFAALGEFEALSALAGLRYDNPAWCFADLVDARTTPVITAQAIGHPLLYDPARVANDVTVGPPGSFVLVTGSNMSGKSTLLRSVGINAVLAQAGGPVCAKAFRLPPVSLGTSIRVQDSLGDGVSLFLAELQRLKQIVSAAGAVPPDSDRLVLYLLDEILHGTNTVERQVAVRRVMTHLLAQRAIGMISTHDLSLADVEPLTSCSRPVHFRESFDETPSGRQMTFDYKLREGIATTTNALALLDMVGLSESRSPNATVAPPKQPDAGGATN